MSQVKILKYQCPRGHLIAGVGFNTEKTSETEAKAILLGGLLRMNVNPWCQLCGSRELKFVTSEESYDKLSDIAPIIAAELNKIRQIVLLKRNAANN